MKTQILTTTALLLALGASPAFAAAAAPAAAAPAAAPITPPPGPAIPGVCVVSYERAVAQAQVGAALQTRLQQLAAQVQAELTPERTAIETEGKTLETQRSTLAPAVFEQRATALNARIEAYQQKEQQRSQELDATRQQQLQRVVAELNPIVVSIYTAQKCSVVMEAQGLVAVNPAMDLTNQAITQLNGKMPTITFERTRLDQQQGAAPPPAR
jgi:outer membrane protein